MNSQASIAGAKSDLKGVGQRARRRVAYRLLPFVFLLYTVNYIDRVNVSFANLRMSADAIGLLNDRTHSLAASFAFIALVYVAAGGLILSLKTRTGGFLNEMPGH